MVFHPTIAPYRIDFFNSLYESFETKVCLYNTTDKTFEYDNIYSQLIFRPTLLKNFLRIGSRFLNKGYWDALDKLKPDIVLVGEYGIGTLQVLLHRLLKRRKYKIVSICDDSFSMLKDGNDFGIQHRIARKIVVPFLNEIILVEPQSCDWYRERFGKGYYFPIIRQDEKQRDVYRRVLPLSRQLVKENNLENKNVFLFVGRFVVLKNIDTVIEAFSKLDPNKNALILIGSGDEEVRLKQIAKKKGFKPIFTGRLEGDNLYAWYNVADYFVLASYLEPFGAVTNEALLAGCYSLVSNKAGSRCLIEEDVNGYTFNPKDTDELAKKMKLLVKRFPPLRPMINVKPNLMKLNYDIEMSKLIGHLNSI